MKKILLALLIAAVVVPTFAQVTVSGDVKFAAIIMPSGDANEVNVINEDFRVYVGYKDDYNSGKVTFRAQPANAKNNNTNGKPTIYIDNADFTTNFGKLMGLEGINFTLTGGYKDLNSGKIISMNPFELSRIEYNLGKGLNLRIDAGVPMVAGYIGLDVGAFEKGAKYSTGDAAFYPMIIGAKGSVAGLQYEAAWAKPGNVDEVGSLMAQARYGLTLTDTMSLTIGAGVDVDLDDGTDGNKAGTVIAGDAGDLKYVAALQFNMLGPIGVKLGIDFNGNTKKNDSDEQLWLTNALAADVLVTSKIVDFEAGAVFDLNGVTTGDKTGMVVMFAGIRKMIAKNEIRLGFAYGNPNGQDIKDSDGSGFRLSTDTRVYANLDKLYNTDKNMGIYLSTYIKF